jgi:hypothetical protein
MKPHAAGEPHSSQYALLHISKRSESNESRKGKKNKVTNLMKTALLSKFKDAELVA